MGRNSKSEIRSTKSETIFKLTKGEEISKQLVSEFRNLDLSLWFVSDFDIRILWRWRLPREFLLQSLCQRFQALEP